MIAGRGARRAIGLGLLLVPSLLWAPAAVESAGGTPARSASRRAVAKAPRADAGPRPQGCTHVVRRGDSLGRIAAEHGVTRQSIASANHLEDPRAVRAGQRLEIPGCRLAGARGSVGPDTAATAGEREQLVARVGPRRIPTQLFLAVPDFASEAVEFRWPVEGPVASGFGRRRGGWHAGVDIQAEVGAPIRAAAAGTVLFSGWERYYGFRVKLQHAFGFTSTYAHNLENLVEAGDEVEAGAVIATVGRSGHASAYHLHFEIRRAGVAYNPLHLVEAGHATVVASVSAPLGDDERRE